MKVLHISTEKNWRGGENQLLNLLKGLSERQIKNYVVVRPGTPMIERFSPHARVHPLKMSNDLDIYAAWKIAQICRDESIGIVHAHTARGHSLGLLAKKLLKTTHPTLTFKLIVHRRVLPKEKLTFFERLKYQSPSVDRYICVSKAVAVGLAASGVQEQKIRIVYSAVDATRFAKSDELRKLFRDENLIPPDMTVVSAIAAVETQKGSGVLIEAWKALSHSCPKAKLFVVGQGNLLDDLKANIAKANLSSDVIFTGFRDDIPKIMAGSDVVVLPTLWEGLGTVLIEALLAGSSVIGSNVGGVPEIIIDGKTGLLVTPGDPASLRQALERMIHDRDLRKNLAIAGREHVLKNFSLAGMVDGVARVYQE